MTTGVDGYLSSFCLYSQPWCRPKQPHHRHQRRPSTPTCGMTWRQRWPSRPVEEAPRQLSTWSTQTLISTTYPPHPCPPPPNRLLRGNPMAPCLSGAPLQAPNRANCISIRGGSAGGPTVHGATPPCIPVPNFCNCAHYPLVLPHPSLPSHVLLIGV